MKKKRKKVLVVRFVIVFAVVIAIILGYNFFYADHDENVEYGYVDDSILDSLNGSAVYDYCSSDSECVPSSCCHASSCAFRQTAFDCGKVYCTQECRAGTLDCGNGKCSCIQNKCVAVFE